VTGAKRPRHAARSASALRPPKRRCGARALPCGGGGNRRALGPRPRCQRLGEAPCRCHAGCDAAPAPHRATCPPVRYAPGPAAEAAAVPGTAGGHSARRGRRPGGAGLLASLTAPAPPGRRFPHFQHCGAKTCGGRKPPEHLARRARPMSVHRPNVALRATLGGSPPDPPVSPFGRRNGTAGFVAALAGRRAIADMI